MARAKKRAARRTSNARWWWIGGAVALVVVAAIGWWMLANPASSNPSVISTLNTRDYHSLAFHPTNPEILYFGHHGGIMQSMDGGRTWNALPTIQQDAMGMAIARSDPNLITIAGHNVLSQSRDGGRTWQSLPSNLPGLDLHAFAIHPTNPQTYYAYSAGFGLFKSQDSGVTWNLVSRDVPPSTTSIAIQAGEPETILIGSGQEGLQTSDNGGKTWTRRASDKFQAVIGLARTDAGELLAATEQGVFASANGGAVWTRLNVDTGVALALAVSPSSPQRLVVVNDKGQVFRSDDGGTTWGK